MSTSLQSYKYRLPASLGVIFQDKRPLLVTSKVNSNNWKQFEPTLLQYWANIPTKHEQVQAKGHDMCNHSRICPPCYEIMMRLVFNKLSKALHKSRSRFQIIAISNEQIE